MKQRDRSCERGQNLSPKGRTRRNKRCRLFYIRSSGASDFDDWQLFIKLFEVGATQTHYISVIWYKVITSFSKFTNLIFIFRYSV